MSIYQFDTTVLGSMGFVSLCEKPHKTYVVKFYCCWTWQIWIVFYVESCGVSSAECRVHLVGVNRRSVIFLVVHSWQNGTRCRDGVNVLWCRSHPVWLVLRVPSLYALVFIWKTFL